MKIVVVGGGPSGLYLAMLVRKRRPDWSVVVLEQNPPNATFGFGVVIAETGRNILCAADEESHRALMEKMTLIGFQVITVKEKAIVVDRPTQGGAIRRIDLLEVLQDAALRAGVELRAGVRLQEMDELDRLGLADADLVVGADGVNSVVRSAYEQAFGTRRSHLTNWFAWFGVGKAFPSSALVFRAYQGGHFVAHYYPYAPAESTFVAECDAATWARFGLEQKSAVERKALFEQVFAPELGGHPLLENNSIWRQFPVIRNDRWVHGRHVLIGDAQTSAHPSIGSGTRIAMEDSIALAEALTGSDQPLQQKLERFVAMRKPNKDKLVTASERSFMWYERIAEWMSTYSPEEFVYRFMTRTGRMSDERLAASAPKLYAQLRQARILEGRRAPSLHS